MRTYRMLFAVMLGAMIAACGEVHLADRSSPAEDKFVAPECACPTAEWVCGVDGITYDFCEVECQGTQGVEVAHEGPCVAPPLPHECDVWIQVSDPVCGVDGNTYENSEHAGCLGVEIEHKGRCACLYPDNYDPVCGDDGETYSNAGHAHCEGVDVVHEGPCVSGCTQDWSPVCGLDGKTYSNVCIANVRGTNAAHLGVCGCDCPDVYEPVCTSVFGPATYDNACQAECANVAIEHEGPCLDEPSIEGFGFD